MSALYNLMFLISKVSNDDFRHAGIGLQMVLFSIFWAKKMKADLLFSFICIVAFHQMILG